jgi:hypothetical protein
MKSCVGWAMCKSAHYNIVVVGVCCKVRAARRLAMC